MDDNKQIIAITGPSLAGKTTLTEELLKIYDFKIPRHVTTRKSRIDDKPGFYKYISIGDFKALENNNKFLISSGHNNLRYGILKDDCDECFSYCKHVLINISYKDIYNYLEIEYKKILIALTFNNISNGIIQRYKIMERKMQLDEILMRIHAALDDHKNFYNVIERNADCLVKTDINSKEETLNKVKKVLDNKLII